MSIFGVFDVIWAVEYPTAYIFSTRCNRLSQYVAESRFGFECLDFPKSNGYRLLATIGSHAVPDAGGDHAAS